MMHNQKQLKNKVKNYWNAAPCGTEFIKEKKYSPAYFEAIEQFRYSIEPEIFSFAQFTRFHGKKILEVGVGAGTDFLQWARAGTLCHGIDLTEEAVNHVRQRLALNNLQAQEIQVADAEKIPYENNLFDLVYSWGVIHHSPNTEKCFKEIIRVTKPDGAIKVMIYNRHSLFALYQYMRSAFLKGKPWKSFKHVLFHHQESPGTKAYTKKEIFNMLAGQPVTIVSITSPVSRHDLLYYKSKPVRFFASLLANICGRQRCGWFMLIELRKN